MNSDATHLHWYQCSFCKAWMTSPLKMLGHFKCQGCLRFLSFKFSIPITTLEQRARTERGFVYSRPDPPSTPPERRCGLRLCFVYKPEAEMVYVPGLGRFCSQAHAEQHQQEMDALLERVRKVKEEKPWLNQ